jgi:excisionase family DNA binding protein
MHEDRKPQAATDVGGSQEGVLRRGGQGGREAGREAPGQALDLLRLTVRSELLSLLTELGARRPPAPAYVGPPSGEPTESGEAETMDVRELSAMLGLNRKTTYNQITQGQIPGVRRLGRRIVVHRVTVLNWLRNGQGSVPRSRR